MSRPSAWSWLERLSTLVVLIAAVVFLYQQFGRTTPQRRSQEPALPTEAVSLTGAAGMGDARARVALIIFSDFECPFCAQFARGTWEELRKKYISTGRVRVAFRHLPIEQIHPSAVKAAEIAECSSRQGRFWETHDLLFGVGEALQPGKTPPKLVLGSVLPRIHSSGLDQPKFAACLEGEATEAVRRDIATAEALGIRSTPTFLVGTVLDDGTVRVKTSSAVPGLSRTSLAFWTRYSARRRTRDRRRTV